MFAGMNAQTSRPAGFAASVSLFTWVLVCGLPGLRIALSAQDQSKPYAITSQVNLVTLPVTVRDSKGRFVSDFEASNFRVFEDGQQQEVSVFRKDDIAVTVGLVVDHSGSMAAKEEEVADGAQTFVQASNPQDREFVVNFADTVTLGLPPNVAFTSNINMLQNALSAVNANGETALYDAVAVALEKMQKDPLDKKVLLLISDGGDNMSKHTFAQVLQMAQASNVIIYTIGLFDEQSADTNPKVLKRFADETGGYAYLPNSPKEVRDVCRQIAEDIRHQYTLGYTPTDAGHSGYRKIRVTASAPGHGKLFVRTRSGYFVPSSSPAN
jgi:Ca-activated chloride channel family protein